MPTAGELYYILHESGDLSRPPLVLIHDLGGNSLEWPAEIRRLAAGRVIALDLPGHGKSKGAGRQSIADYAESVATCLQSLALKKVVIVGAGMGGAVALELARCHRPLLGGICLLGTGVRLPIPQSILANVGHVQTYPAAVRDLAALMSGPHTEAATLQALTKRLLSTRPSVLQADLLACDAFDFTHPRACDAFDFTHPRRRIRLPALILCGTEDRFAPAADAQVLIHHLPQAALQTIDGAGHLIAQEQPRRVAALLDLFTATLR